MERSEGRLSGSDQAVSCLGGGQACPVCGGSGVLRTDGAGHRTCLDCLGRGTRPCGDGADLLSPADLLRRRGWRGGFRGDLSAWTSGAR